jgi:HlyD family secretion protein
VFAYPGRKFTGHVAQIRLNPKIEAGVVKYNCVIHVDNDDLALKPGMTATVSIETARSENILKVPTTALRFVPDLPPEQLQRIRKKMPPNEGIVWVPGDKGLEPRQVTIGTMGEKEIEISGENISEGMSVAIPPKRDDAERKRRFGLSLF